MLDTRGVDFALDIEGANGEVIRAFMEKNPELRGAVFDGPAAPSIAASTPTPGPPPP